METFYKNPFSSPQLHAPGYLAQSVELTVIKDPSGIRPRFFQPFLESGILFPGFFFRLIFLILSFYKFQNLVTLIPIKAYFGYVIQGSQSQGTLCITEIFIHRKDYEFHLRIFFFTHFHQFNSINLRHVYIREYNIHFIILQKFQCFTAILDIAHNFKSIFSPIHYRNQTFSCQFIIIYNQYLHFSIPSFSVPDPVILILFRSSSCIGIKIVILVP